MPRSLYTGISQLALPHVSEGAGNSPVDVVHDAALVIENGKVVYAGPADDATPKGPADLVDLGGRAVVPGFVDSHSHIVFAGDRIDEMARRTRGESYEEIAAAGGGIVRSVAALQDATVDEIENQARKLLDVMHRAGTTTLEIKTGYGLTPSLELKQLDVIERLRSTGPVDIFATLLAHVVPPAQRTERDIFIEKFITELIEAAAPRADFADVFVESGAYTDREARHIIDRAKAAGLKIKLHVDQLREGGGAALAAEVGALSADHLEYTNQDGRRALAEAGVVATVLPGCKLFLGKGPWPPARELRDAGCEVAVATDCNPGSSTISDLALCGTLAATLCGLSLEEALWGITRGGAKALGLTDRGTLRPGERADFVVVDDPDWRALFYRPGYAPIERVAVAGKVTVTSTEAL